jgi:predicted nucleic acid-binding protein
MTLAKLNLLHLLQELYGRVYFAQSVYEEAVELGTRHGYADAGTLRHFLDQTGWTASDVDPAADISEDLQLARLDRGERDTLALAERLGSSLVLMDEAVGREIVRRRGLAVRGSLGILIQAYRQGIIEADRLRLYFGEMARRDDVWINPTLVDRLLGEVLADE